jgi:hypothetical protein
MRLLLEDSFEVTGSGSFSLDWKTVLLRSEAETD